MSEKVVVAGGGWSGIAAAISAKKAGADVEIIERTDLLLGLGNVGGIMRNNGRFVAAEENIALGAKELFQITDRLSRHVNIDFPGHRHASLYDVMLVEPAVRRLVKDMGIEVRFMARACDVEYEDSAGGRNIRCLVLQDGTRIEGGAFVDATGSTGPMGNCTVYGNGCAMCILRCAAFGPRISITDKAGLSEIMGMRKDGSMGAMSGACKIEKATLSEDIRRKLDQDGVVIISLEKEQIRREKLDMKVCQQYALEEYAENIVLLDTGYAKLMTPFYPLEKLREIKGFENARYADPYAGGRGNSIRYLSVAERDNTMLVKGAENLFCGGEKSGLFVGHTEAITTGSLAGHNACRYLAGLKRLVLPEGLAVGDLISYG
ncbi:MAG: FAD-dependent oxidoreductase, partial [Firmicutes bacterium]|nr:FAD-dependent oxidoreductase [Bacillota bacterium]